MFSNLLYLDYCVSNQLSIKMKKLIILSVLVVAAVYGKKYCRNDDECMDDEFGELVCIKSMCDWGVCGCPHGQAARFMGSEDLYRCVDIKKIGEHCSSNDDEGVCGPAGSYCDDEEEICKCSGSSVPKWGGEACMPESSVAVGDTCGSTGSCSAGSCKSQSYDSSTWHRQVEHAPPTCACDEDEKLVIGNTYMTNSNFVSKKQPMCENRMVGDFCFEDRHCGNVDVVCHNNKCVCKEAGAVPNYDGSSCRKALPFGAKCNPAEAPQVAVGDNTWDYHCDGEKGLVCGDMCAIYGSSQWMPNSTNNVCGCGPHHKTSGTSCSQIGEGDACFGDYNCKMWSKTAICVEGVCKAGVTTLVAGLVSLLVPIMAYFLRI